jgi:hypothetical protein
MTGSALGAYGMSVPGRFRTPGKERHDAPPHVRAGVGERCDLRRTPAAGIT